MHTDEYQSYQQQENRSQMLHKSHLTCPEALWMPRDPSGMCQLRAAEQRPEQQGYSCGEGSTEVASVGGVSMGTVLLFLGRAPAL